MIPRNLIFLVLPLLAASHATPVHKKSTDLICPDSGAECYSKHFIATHEFQRILPGQDIPPGLHVRLDVQTGEKEAKLYVPGENATTNDVVVVPGETTSGEVEAPELALPADAPLEKPLKLTTPKPPKTVNTDLGVFEIALESLKGNPTADALSPLEELVHDSYWGHRLTSAPGAVTDLLAILDSSDASLRAAAALTLGAALSNNPKALHSAVEVKGLQEKITTALEKETDQTATKRLLFLLGQVLWDEGVLSEFTSKGGVKMLENVWQKGKGEVRGRIAVVLEDAFLNADMREGGVIRKNIVKPMCATMQSEAMKKQDERVLSAVVAAECEVSGEFAGWVDGYTGEYEELVGKMRGIKTEL
jgi:nucleotide exchange factor SIL1